MVGPSLRCFAYDIRHTAHVTHYKPHITLRRWSTKCTRDQPETAKCSRGSRPKVACGAWDSSRDLHANQVVRETVVYVWVKWRGIA
jgi:hypothetical protein